MNFSGLVGNLDEFLCLIHPGGHGLFDENMLPVFEGAFRSLIVLYGRKSYNDRVDFSVLQNRFAVRGWSKVVLLVSQVLSSA